MHGAVLLDAAGLPVFAGLVRYDEAVERARAELGKEWPFVVNGEERWTDEKYEEPSPIDKDLVIGRFSQDPDGPPITATAMGARTSEGTWGECTA